MFRAGLAAFLILLCAAPATAAQGAPASQAGVDAAQTVYIATYRRGPKFDPAKAGANPGIREHIQHFTALGPRLIAAGVAEQRSGDDPLGYVILRAPDRASVQAWLAADPALIAGTMVAEVRRWGVSEVNGWRRLQAPSTPK